MPERRRSFVGLVPLNLLPEEKNRCCWLVNYGLGYCKGSEAVVQFGIFGGGSAGLQSGETMGYDGGFSRGHRG